MDVSVITTCKGRLHHLRRSLPAMLAQRTGVTYEVIVVDYACPDGAGRWAASLGDRRVRVVHVEAAGTEAHPAGRFNISHARNRGAAAAARGDLLAFVDADTVVDPGWLACVIERMAISGAVLCRHRFDGPDAELIMWGTCAVRADAFRTIRGYDEAIERWGMEDTDLYRRLSEIGAVAYYDNALLSCIDHADDERTRFHPGLNKDYCFAFTVEYLAGRRGVVNPDGWGGPRPETRGVVTAAHEGYFPGLKLLARSIRAVQPWPITCIDLGLSEEQRAWCAAHHVDLLPVEKLPIPKAVRSGFAGTDAVRRAHGGAVRHLWCKPWYMDAGPYTVSIWIDSDAVVLRPLSELFELGREGMVAVPEVNNPAATPNDPELYRLLPVESWDNHSGLNSGVVLLRRGRDDDVLGAWKHCVVEAARRPEVERAVSYHDQGALLWAVFRTGRLGRITPDTTWNHPANSRSCHFPRARYVDDSRLFDRLRKDHPGAGIVHWMATPKLWRLLRRPATRAVIAFLDRSGSQMLRSQLDAHPEARWLEEVMNPLARPAFDPRRDDPVTFIERQAWSKAGHEAVIGFNWKLRDAGRQALAADREVKVILLERENLLARLASWMIAERTGDWFVTSGRAPGVAPSFRVTPKWLAARFEEHRRLYAQARGLFRDHDLVEVTYERLLDDPNEWRRVAEFLGLAPTRWRPATVRQEVRPLSEVFTNFGELREAFAETEDAWMFEERAARSVG